MRLGEDDQYGEVAEATKSLGSAIFAFRFLRQPSKS
jgi:hypothetical protein